MKKIFAIILIISILFSFELAYANSINLAVESKTAMPGDEVSINISLSNNTGIIAALLKLDWDNTQLKLTDVKDGGLLMGATFNPDYTKMPYTMLWNSASAKNFTDNGTLATLTFKVLETAKNGEAYIKLSYNEDDVFDVDLNNVALNISNGTIKVVGAKENNINTNTAEDGYVYFEDEPIAETFVQKTSTSETEIKNDVKTPDFTDVNTGDWYYAAVMYATENKLMNGVSEKSFAPDVNLTRAMLVTILYRNEKEPNVNMAVPFTDVDTNSYYSNAVIWAQANGIVSGVSESEFDPDASITREQIATIIYRYAKYKEYDINTKKSADIISYSDSYEISDFAIDAMKYAIESGIITGKTESTLNPLDNATRAEVATILMRFLENNK